MVDAAELGKKIEVLFEKFDRFSSETSIKLNALHVDVVVIKKELHHIEQIDKIVRGNGGGLVTRVTRLEDKGSGKEKWSFLVIGGLISGLIALILRSFA